MIPLMSIVSVFQVIFARYCTVPSDGYKPGSQHCMLDNCAFQNNEEMFFSDPVNPEHILLKVMHF